MNENIFQSEEEYLFLDNISNNNHICEFDVNFLKTLHLSEPCECALIELNVSNELIVKKYQKHKVQLKCYFEPSIPDYLKKTFVHKDDPRYFDIQTNTDYPNDETHDFVIEDIQNIDQLLESFKKISTDSVQIMETFYKKRFGNATFIENMNLKKPKMLYENGYLVNYVGKILFRGIEENNLNFIRFDKTLKTADMETIFNTEHRHWFFGWTGAVFYFNFDKDFLKILGFQQNITPTIFSGRYFAVNRCEINPLHQLFLYTNIVKESYCGAIKKPLLKVIQKIISTHDIVTYTCQNLMYIPVKVNEINSIKLNLTDKFDNILTYKKGFMSAILVIRPIRNI